MNILDLIVLGIIIILALASYRKGFIRACFSFLPTCISLIATYIFQPILSRFLRGTPLYSYFKGVIGDVLGLEGLITDSVLETQVDIINKMQFPEFIKSALIENNNSVVYDVLDVAGIEEYISGFIANICTNIISLIIIFVIVFITLKVLLGTLDLFSRLPIISFFNKICGFFVGIIQGVFGIWIFGVILTFFNYSPKMVWFFSMLYESTAALWLYENNFLLALIVKIFT